MNAKITVSLRDLQPQRGITRNIQGHTQRAAFLVNMEGRKSTPSVAVDGREELKSRWDLDLHDQAGVGAPENWRRIRRFVGYCSMDLSSVSIASFGFM